jgi:hypothetical protein
MERKNICDSYPDGTFLKRVKPLKSNANDGLKWMTRLMS